MLHKIENITRDGKQPGDFQKQVSATQPVWNPIYELQRATKSIMKQYTVI